MKIEDIVISEKIYVKIHNPLFSLNNGVISPKEYKDIKSKSEVDNICEKIEQIGCFSEKRYSKIDSLPLYTFDKVFIRKMKIEKVVNKINNIDTHCDSLDYIKSRLKEIEDCILINYNKDIYSL